VFFVQRRPHPNGRGPNGQTTLPTGSGCFGCGGGVWSNCASSLCGSPVRVSLKALFIPSTFSCFLNLLRTLQRMLLISFRASTVRLEGFSLNSPARALSNSSLWTSQAANAFIFWFVFGLSAGWVVSVARAGMRKR